MLEQHNLAIISGMAGIGKSQLALALAHQVAEPERTFWHTFHENEGIESVIWRVAAFLAWHEQDDVWRMLENSQQTGAQLPPLSTLVDYLTQTMRGKRYLLCIDDLHHVEEDPAAAEPILKLTQMVQDGDISVIITSRRMPAFAQWIPENQLHGLSLDDTTALLNTRGMELAHDYVRQLHENTGGNAQFLNLIIQALRKSPNPQRLVNNLLDADDLERWLLNEVNSQLSPEEQAVMNACSAMMGYPATRGAIEATLEGQRVRTPLRSLTDAHLLNFSEGAEEREYHLHAIVGDFYYEQLNNSSRKRLHHNAAEYYKSKERDVYRSVLHFEQAGVIDEAAQLMTDHFQQLLDQGHLRPMRRLLEQVDAVNSPTRVQAAASTALGRVYMFVGEDELAKAQYKRARRLCDSLEDAYVLLAQCSYGLAELAERDSFEIALDWAEQGLEELRGRDPELEARIYSKMGGIWDVLGDTEAAEQCIQLSLAKLPVGPHPSRIWALQNLGVLSYRRGKFAQAVDAWREALDACSELTMPFIALGLQNNLGACHLIAGNWDEAHESFTTGLHDAARLGSAQHGELFHLNLGILAMWQGEDDEAERHLAPLNEKSGEYATNSAFMLAELRLHQGEIDEALGLLEEAEARINAASSLYQLPELYSIRARVELAFGRQGVATEYAKNGQRLSQEQQMNREEGLAHFALGQIYAAQNSTAQEIASYQAALSVLGHDFPYDSARVQLAWGKSLLASDAEQALPLLTEAHATFARLGAKRELAIAEQLMA